MTLYQFKLADELEQLEAIWYKSTKLAERDDFTFHYNLYQIDSFYVEERIIKDGNIRDAFISFSSTNSSFLQPYLDQIKITVK